MLLSAQSVKQKGEYEFNNDSYDCNICPFCNSISFHNSDSLAERYMVKKVKEKNDEI